MKKLILVSTLFLIFKSSSACEFCGCSSGNYFIGAFPQFKKYFVGTRYSFRTFTTKASADPSQYSKDFYQTVELWVGVNLGSRWQVLAFLPYSINQQNSDDGMMQTQGLGDATLIANYSLMNMTRENGIAHQLWLGGGIKLPTGKFELDPDNLVASANNQPGTGSLDYLANFTYVFRSNEWSLNSNINYKINQSADAFKFGNRLAGSAFIFRSLYTIKATYRPNAGLLFENLQASRNNSLKVDGTGGYTLLAVGGLETTLNHMTVGFNAQLPLSQNMSAGQTTTKLRGMVHITYTF
jgi:hypothetical protein